MSGIEIAFWILLGVFVFRHAVFLLCYAVVVGFRKAWAFAYNKANPPVRFRTSITMDRTTKRVAKSIEQVS